MKKNMEINNNELPLSEQVDYKKMKSDWHVFNNQQEYDFKRPDKFYSEVTKIAKQFKIMKDIDQLQSKLQKEK